MPMTAPVAGQRESGDDDGAVVEVALQSDGVAKRSIVTEADVGILEGSPSASAAAVSISGLTRKVDDSELDDVTDGDNAGDEGIAAAASASGADERSEDKVAQDDGRATPIPRPEVATATATANAADDVISTHRQEDGRDERQPEDTHQQHATGDAQRTSQPESRLILEKYVLYKTESRIYIVASDQSQTHYRILKIDRHYSPTDAHHELNIIEDGMVYTKAEVNGVIEMIGDGNKTVGGCQMVIPMFYGIVGFVRFTAGWYAVLIKRRAPVGLVGGHYIYHCEESLMMLISHNAKPEKPSDENRLYNAFQQVDLSKNFYFSYSYDLTNTLQTNLTRPASHIPAAIALRERQHCMADHAFHEPLMLDSVKPEAEIRAAWGFNDKFMWNHFLLRPAFFEKIREKKDASCWVLPLVHGFVDQAKISIFGRTVYVTIIARRSRYFAGARFLKRGVNDEGNVANDVETEQIVHEALTTSFYSGPSDATEGRKLTPRYTSYVQHRGSIPLSWQQDTSTSSLKPPIHLHLIDPYHSAAALHFDDLFARYGAPIVALNLIKAREHEPRESRLIGPYKECIDYLNQFLPEAKKIKLIPFDMSAAYKNRSMDVIGVLEDIAEEVLETTKFFHSGGEPVAYSTQMDLHNDSSEPYPYRSTAMLQNGVCRTNCIDCLDRTNAAQFVIAKAAFGHQLHALGILSKPHLAYDSDAVNLLTEMYHDHGDTIALQYGGSHLVNTMNTYRKINQWESHSRDMIESLKRLYANVALDQDKQNSINLFLGIDAQHDTIAGHAGRPAITGSLAAEKAPPEGTGTAGAEDKQIMPTYDALRDIVWTRRDYRCWFTQEFLDNELSAEDLDFLTQSVAQEDTDYWLEYYRPRLFTIFERHFAFKVNSTARYNPRMHGDRFIADANELSPFKERPTVLSHPPRINVGVRRWMSVNHKRSQEPLTAAKDADADGQDHVDGTVEDDAPLVPLSNSTEALASRLLKPKVTRAEADEYASYVDQYRNLNLSNELHYEHSAGDLEIYDTAVRIAEGDSVLSNMLQVDVATLEMYEKHTHAFKASRTPRAL